MTMTLKTLAAACSLALASMLGAPAQALECYRDALELSLKGKVKPRKRRTKRARARPLEDDPDDVAFRSSN